jgi:uncharacterized membrane protein YhhN
MKKIQRFTVLFSILTILDLFFVWKFPEFRWLSKPLIVISLLIHFYVNISHWTYVERSFGIALLFALLGDVFLFFDGALFFAMGLSSFLIMQLLYAFSFQKDSFDLGRQRVVHAILISFIGCIFLWLIWTSLGEMRLPVLIYTGSIICMTCFALLRGRSQYGYMDVVYGALFFMISDGLIAWTRFMDSIDYGGLLIMSTYIFAQYLIVTGFLKSRSRSYS